MIVFPLGGEVPLGDTTRETVEGVATGLHESELSLFVAIVSFGLQLQQERSAVSFHMPSFSPRRTLDNFDCALEKVLEL